MPVEDQTLAQDPRAELERLRKIKRLRELEAKASGQQPSVAAAINAPNPGVADTAVDPLMPKDPVARAQAIERQKRSEGLIPLTTENGTEWVKDPAAQVRSESDSRWAAVRDARAQEADAIWRRDNPGAAVRQDLYDKVIQPTAASVENAIFTPVKTLQAKVDPKGVVPDFIHREVTPRAAAVGQMIDGGRMGGVPGALTGGVAEWTATMARDPQQGLTEANEVLNPIIPLSEGYNQIVDASGDLIDGIRPDTGRKFLQGAGNTVIGMLGVSPGTSMVADAIRAPAQAERAAMVAQRARAAENFVPDALEPPPVTAVPPTPPRPQPAQAATQAPPAAPVQPRPAPVVTPAAAGGNAVPPPPPPKQAAFTASPEPARSKGSIARNTDRIAGGAAGAFVGGTADAWAAPGDGNGGDNGMGGAAAGGLIGSFIPRVGRSAARRFRTAAQRASFDERVASRAVRGMLKAAGIKTAEDARALGISKFGDKPAVVADLSQEAIGAAGGTARLPGKTGEAARSRYDALTEGRAGRVEQDFSAATGLSPSTVSGDIKRMADEAAAAATPEYEALRAGYPVLISDRLESMKAGSPTLASSVKAVDAYKAERLATKGEATGDFEFWDLVKRDIDHKEQALIDQGVSMDDLRIRNLENARSELVAELDRLIPEQYAQARLKGGEAPRIRKAFDEGKRFLGNTYREDELAAKVAELTGAPLTAAQAGMIRTIMGKVDGSGAGIATLRSPATRKQLATVFGEDVANQIQRRLEADAMIMQNAARMNPNVGSATSQVEMGGGAGQMAAAIIKAARSPFETILNGLANMGYSKAQRDLIGEMLLGDISDATLARIYRSTSPNPAPRTPAGTATPNTPPARAGFPGSQTNASPTVTGALVSGGLGYAASDGDPNVTIASAIGGGALGALAGKLGKGGRKAPPPPSRTVPQKTLQPANDQRAFGNNITEDEFYGNYGAGSQLRPERVSRFQDVARGDQGKLLKSQSPKEYMERFNELTPKAANTDGPIPTHLELREAAEAARTYVFDLFHKTRGLPRQAPVMDMSKLSEQSLEMGFNILRRAGYHVEPAIARLDAVNQRFQAQLSSLGRNAVNPEVKAALQSTKPESGTNVVAFDKPSTPKPPIVKNGFGSSPLPMDEASRMARAIDDGFDVDTTLYHQTAKDFDAFELGADPTSHSGGGAIWLRKDPRKTAAAHQVAGREEIYREGAHEKPVFIRKGKELDYRTEQNLQLEGKLNQQFPYVLSVEEGKMLRDLGFTHADRGNEVLVFDPSNIRGKFAKFDPSQSSSSKLLAGMGDGKSRAVMDNLKQDVAIAGAGSVMGSVGNQDDPQAGALQGMGLALGGKYALRAAGGLGSAVKKARDFRPVRGVDQAGLGGSRKPPAPKGPPKPKGESNIPGDIAKRAAVGVTTGAAVSLANDAGADEDLSGKIVQTERTIAELTKAMEDFNKITDPRDKQRFLKNAGFYAGNIDGDIAGKTTEGIDAWTKKQEAAIAKAESALTDLNKRSAYQKNHPSAMMEAWREYGPTTVGILAALGMKMARGSSAKKSVTEAASKSKNLNRLITKGPVTGIINKADEARTANLNDLWKKGGAKTEELPFKQDANGKWKANPKAKLADELFPQNGIWQTITKYVKGKDIGIILGSGLEATAMQPFIDKANSDLREAELAWKDKPSDETFKKLEDAKNAVMAYTLVQRLGIGLGAGRILGSIGAGYAKARPNIPAAATEQANLGAYLAGQKPPPRPRAPKLPPPAPQLLLPFGGGSGGSNGKP